MLSHDSFTRSIAQQNIAAWAKQKRRHLSAATYYRKDDKARLVLEPLSRVAYYGLLISLLVMLVSWPVVLFIALGRLVMRVVILRQAVQTFNEERLWFFSLFFDIFAPFVSAFLYLTSGRKGKGRETWK